MRCPQCKLKFTKKLKAQKYCSHVCKNRAAQKRLRERAKVA